MNNIIFSLSFQNFVESFEKFRSLLHDIGDPKFESADIVYDVDSDSNPEYPLILSVTDGRTISISGVPIGTPGPRVTAITFLLREAGFGQLPSLSNALCNEKSLNITVWNTRLENE